MKERKRKRRARASFARNTYVFACPPTCSLSFRLRPRAAQTLPRVRPDSAGIRSVVRKPSHL